MRKQVQIKSLLELISTPCLVFSVWKRVSLSWDPRVSEGQSLRSVQILQSRAPPRGQRWPQSGLLLRHRRPKHWRREKRRKKLLHQWQRAGRMRWAGCKTWMNSWCRTRRNWWSMTLFSKTWSHRSLILTYRAEWGKKCTWTPYPRLEWLS